jgi:hypothetical protein
MRFSKEERFALIRVPGELNNISSPLQDPQITDDIRDFLMFERGEGWHACSGDSIADNAGQLAVSHMLYFGSCGDIRCVLPAAAIRTVATRAVGSEDGAARRLRVQSAEREQRKDNHSDADALPPTLLRQRTSLLC